MEEQQFIIEEEESINIVAIILRLIKYWYFIFIAIILSISAAYFYTKFASPVYEVSTTLMIKEGTSAAPAEKVLEDMNLFSKKKSIQNEIVILQSYSTIWQTIKQLDFSVSYYSNNGYSLTELYHASPFIVIFDSLELQPINIAFDLELVSFFKFKLTSHAEEIDLYSFQTDKVINSTLDFHLDTIYSFGAPVKTKECSFVIIKNPDLTKSFIPELKYHFKLNNLNWQTLFYKKQIQIDLLKKEVDVLNISLQGNNVNKITDFLNQLCTVYINRDLEKKNSIANNTIEFIDNQLRDISDSLTYAENRLQHYRSSHKIMNLDFQSKQLFERLSSLQIEKASYISNKEYYKYLIKSINSTVGVDELMVPSTIGINDITLNKMVMELVDLNTSRLTLLANSTEKSQIYKNIEDKISNIKKLILLNLQNMLEANRISISNIDIKIETLNKDVIQLPKKQQKLFGFEREFKLNDAIYTFLLQKRAEAQIAKASNLPDSEVIDIARTDVSIKTSAKYSQIYLIALVLGLIIPAVLIYLDYILKDQIQLKKDIERITKTPIVGGIYRHSKSETKAFIKHPKSPVAESFRSFYTNLQFFTKGKKNQIILMTSSMPREGKTFNAINLATVFASFNKKTCLLSFDLRIPKVHTAFNIENDIGLSSYLINHSSIEDIICPTDIKRLDVIPAGPIPPNPVELIASDKTDELFEFLKSNYDCVIIDSPPVGVVADGLMLAKYCDVNVIVVRQTHTRKKVLDAVLKELKANAIENLAILFNGIKQSRIYGHGYGNDYGYYKNN